VTRSAWLGALVALVVAACAAPTPRAPTPPAPVLAPCPVSRIPTGGRCKTLEVFEDRAARAGRTVTIKIVMLPALTDRPRPDPIVVLAGGPGLGAASSVSGEVARFFRPMRERRDIVFVDQRGTGDSYGLRCDLSTGSGGRIGFGELLPLDRIRACRERLEKIADLRLYTTPLAMDDVDDVRAALGYTTINLFGVSYGSLAALQYLRQHPERVRSLTLAGVATPEQKLPLHFAAGAQAALDGVLADCAADRACRGAFPDLAGDLATVLTRLAAGPVTFELPGLDGHTVEPVSMSRPVFAERLRLMLYNLRAASRVPLVLHRAAHGDWVPFARATSAGLAGPPSAFAMGMYLSVTCSEFIPVITDEDIVREARDTFVGEDRTRLHVRACREWPRGTIPPAYYSPVTSDVPVLMLSGALDAATPARYAAAAARTLPNSRQVLIPHAAHEYVDACSRDLVAAFIERGSTRALDTGCAETLRRPPFVTP
jgi:pimeloyl-ACP methyl ester carboxylesterase